MAIPTHIDITYTCGHTINEDLSAKAPGRRKSWANWASRNSECVDCWKKKNKNTWRLEQLENAEANAKKLELPELEGSEKQLEWAPIFRNDLLINAHQELTEGSNPAMTEEEFDEKILDPARKITRAGWWMSNVDSESEDLEVLISTAFDQDPGSVNENPY